MNQESFNKETLDTFNKLANVTDGLTKLTSGLQEIQKLTVAKLNKITKALIRLQDKVEKLENLQKPD